MSEWSPYQTDHLFLLVGANPLPNYVAALLLAKDNSKVYLLHSGAVHGTVGVATNLERAIRNRRPQIEIILREIDEADSGRIVKKMEELLDTVSGQTALGLHYTGGTKAMAVHAHRAVERRFPAAVFSYLDARTLLLKVDGRDSVATKSIPVLVACPVKIDELMRLHGRALKSCDQEARLQQMYCGLVNLHAKNPERWRNWCESNLRRSDNKEKFKSKPNLKSLQLPIGDPDLAQAFKGLGDFETLGQFPLPDGWALDDLAKWLDGRWLEHYVLDSVKRVAADCQIHDYGMSLETIGERPNFEFDVAAMRGYQLFAVSCTTDDKKGRCKEKLFEAYVRARQMGGDEAHVGLVCCYPDPAALRQEIEETWFTEGRVWVFGREDLPNLSDRLKEWFERVNQAE